MDAFSTELKIFPDPKPCHFCVCDADKEAKVPISFRVCGCPCHRQNSSGLDKWLDAVKFFFGDRLT